MRGGPMHAVVFNPGFSQSRNIAALSSRQLGYARTGIACVAEGGLQWMGATRPYAPCSDHHPR
jgi:hypothetical protein